VVWQAVGGSFRDPSGFVYLRGGTLYRQVNRDFLPSFQRFVSSGFYHELHTHGLIVGHQTADPGLAATADAGAVLRPEPIDFISYPYEWCFGQLRDAALLTLELQERALASGFVLRDASAYNVQFRAGRPVLIDTLSFEPRVEGSPWGAYGQFCEHFLVPLALMALRDVRCGSLLRSSLEGIPLDLGSRLLPWRTRLRPGLLFHVHLHARARRRYAAAPAGTVGSGRPMSQAAARALVRTLRDSVSSLHWSPSGTEWADYAGNTSYAAETTAAKRAIVAELVRAAGARTAWDLGANTGEYSRVAREAGPAVVAFDLDPAAVERNYQRVRREGETGILPLLLDLANPSPAQGWAHQERLGLEQRGPADLLLALALVHHLAIGRNVPLPHIADLLARLGQRLVVEFVPKSDSQVQRLLRHRLDVFPRYTREDFEESFGRRFRIDAVRPLPQSDRVLYLMTSGRALGGSR
jgi:SAM-dependent methyltransferase